MHQLCVHCIVCTHPFLFPIELASDFQVSEPACLPKAGSFCNIASTGELFYLWAEDVDILHFTRQDDTAINHIVFIG